MLFLSILYIHFMLLVRKNLEYVLQIIRNKFVFSRYLSCPYDMELMAL